MEQIKMQNLRNTKLPAENVREDGGYLKRRRLVSLLSIGVIALLFLAITVTLGRQVMDFVSNPAAFRDWAAQQGIWGALATAGIMALQVVVAIMPGEAIEIGSGYVYGSIGGMILCLAGAAIGSIIIYGLTRLFGERLTEAFISREKLASLSFIRNAKKLNLLIFLLFFIPGTPKDVFTYFIGLTPMKLSTFLIISSIARIPSVITSTVVGEAMGVQNYFLAAAVFAVTGVVSLGGILLYRHICKSEKENE